MFFKRLITTLILAPLILALIFYGSPLYLGILAFGILLLCGSEWLHLIPAQTGLGKGFFLLGLILFTLLSHYFFPYWLIIGLVIWIMNVVIILTYPNSQPYWGNKATVAFWGFLLLPLFLQSLIHLFIQNNGKSLLIYLLFLIWATDIGAYLAGKLFGKHKLIPRVSPGKSWEGVLGGFILAGGVACLAAQYFLPNNLSHWYLLAFITVIISIFGDLFISILKRRCQLKDTGAIIPGHGGILDRLDSLIAALPFFYYGITWG
ncbi:MAG: phosphatidate cytidylyltransferase [Legionella sp. 40-6]|nr:phosphatidate cytidylyltransferase [Legionella sp.]OJX88082.1 MAG: phosphatidate cytidylyltransferase [Legionella sp. 40-6]